MATKIESEYPLSPSNDESDGEEDQEHVDNNSEGEGEEEEGQYRVDNNSEKEGAEEEYEKPVNNDIAALLKKLQSAGAILKTPKKEEEEYRCYTCEEDFEYWEDLENHLLHQHISLPSLVLEKLPSDEEDTAQSGDENWSDEEALQPPPKPNAKKAPQKVDISQILKKTGISIKKASDANKSSDAALNKLSGLGFTIKKNSTPIKKEKTDDADHHNDGDLMQKLGKLGGIKLKLKSDGKKGGNTFKVINGLKDFKASDDEDEGSDNEDNRNDDESGEDKNQEEEDQESEEEQQYINNSRRSSSNSESGKNNKNAKDKVLLGKKVKTEPVSTVKRAGPASRTTRRESSTTKNQGKTTANETQTKSPPKEPPKVKTAEAPEPVKPSRRPSVKKTPKRGANNPPAKVEEPPPKPPSPVIEKQNKTPERRESQDMSPENVVIKKEIPDPANTESQTSNVPLFTGHIKSERSSPVPPDRAPTPIIARVKTEPDAPPPSNSQPSSGASSISQTLTTPLLPVTKTEEIVTIIEINGDSNDEDDDCCVVSSTPAPDVKPILPKTEKPTTLPPPPYPTTIPSSYPSSVPSSYNSAPLSTPRLSSTPSTEKQHNFNWNAPDSKPAIDVLEKSADEIFESLLSSSTKKESMSMMSDASEYVSLDTLGPQHSCEVCNTRFTDISLLEEHRRLTGHSNSLVTPSSTLLPYNPTSNILSSLLPVKQLAEQVGKLSTIGSSSSSGFTHQQNVMINIQAYPGAGGVMVPPQSYNSYPPSTNSQGGYPQPPPMYPSPGQTMPSPYPGSSYNQPSYGQYPSPMSKSGYPGAMPPNMYSNASSPYTTTSPLQSMQQSVYGQSAPGMHNQQPVPMGPPGSSPSQVYASASSPSAMKQSTSGIRIQNVQTFPPGQMPGGPGQPLNPNQPMGPGHPMGHSPHGPEMSSAQSAGVPGQINAPQQIRMAAGANVTGSRPRMPTNLRGARPSIRPGIQVHGQVRGGAKPGPRMPLKRPGSMVGGAPSQKRRPDMLLPGKHDNEDCHVMTMQKQRDGLPMIQSVQGAKDKLNIGNQISITKKNVTVNKEASAMANVLASRGISVKQKQKSRTPSPPRPLPNLPNLGAGVSIKHSSRSSNFSIPEAKIGGGMLSCKICKKMFMNSASLSVHMSNAHPQSKIPLFKCDECPASYPKSLQLQHHKRVFHNVTGPNRELGLPVVDLSQEDNLKRLSNLGIYSFIPLANREQANGCFGIPVISVHNVQNGMTSSLQALGADGLLSLGPLKPLPNS